MKTSTLLLIVLFCLNERLSSLCIGDLHLSSISSIRVFKVLHTTSAKRLAKEPVRWCNITENDIHNLF